MPHKYCYVSFSSAFSVLALLSVLQCYLGLFVSFSIRYCSALSKTVKWCSELFDVALFFQEIAAKLRVLIIVIIDSFSVCTRLAPRRMRVVDNE